MLGLLSACRGEAPGPVNRQDTARPPPAVVAAPAANEAISEPPQAEAGLAAMTPGQRRAYRRGLADCRAGRYEPLNHPESYRIGCAAAHDR